MSNDHITNSGTINIDGTGTAALSGTTISGGAITNAGKLEVVGGINIISNVIVTDGSNSELTIAGVGTTLTLENDVFKGGLITITIDPGATLNVDNSFIGDAIVINLGGTLNIANSTIETINSSLSGNNTVKPGQTLTLVDELVTGTITNEGIVDIETNGSAPHGVIFDGVAVTNIAPGDGIEVGLTSAPTFLLEDGATIGGGFLSITSGSTLDVERGTSGPGAILVGVLVTNNGVIEVGSLATLTLLGSNVSNTGQVNVLDGGTVELINDTVTGGSINLDSAGAATKLEIAGSVTLTGGTVTLTNNGNNSIVSNGAAATLTNKDSISGAGTIGDGTGGFLTLDNFGDIAATFTTELVLNTGAIAITNEAGATLEGKSGGILEIDSNVTNVNATTSKIVADDGGTVELVNNTITGGAIALNGATTPTMLQIEGTVTLTGGTVTLSDYSGNSIVSTHDEVAGAATLINKDTLSGAGTIGDGSGGLI